MFDSLVLKKFAVHSGLLSSYALQMNLVIVSFYDKDCRRSFITDAGRLFGLESAYHENP